MVSQFRKFVSAEKYTVKRAAALLAVTALLSNVLGLLRNLIFQRYIPYGLLDVYNASFVLPDLIFNILVLGAIGSAFIPVVSGFAAAKNREKAYEITDQLLSWLTLLIAVLAGALYFAMPWIVSHYLPGFDSLKAAQAVSTSRILLLQSFFFAWSWTFGGLLNSFNRFSSYSLAPLLYNILLIFGGIVGAKFGLASLTWITVLGAITHMGIQFYEARKLGYIPKLNFSFSPELTQIFKLMVPRSLSLGTTQIVLAVYTAIASLYATGSITVFKYVNDLQTTPTVIVANSLAVAFFPTLSAKAAEGKMGEVSELLNKVLRSTLFLMIPSVVVGYILRAQIIRLYIGVGQAKWELTTVGIDIFTYFLLGMIATALSAILVRTCFSLKDTATPLFATLASGTASILVAYAAVQNTGTVAGLALAVSVGAWVQVIVLAVQLHFKSKVSLFASSLAKDALRYLISSILAAFTSWLALQATHLIYEATNVLGTKTVVGLGTQLLVSLVAGIVVYFWCTKRISPQELTWVKNSLSSRKNA